MNLTGKVISVICAGAAAVLATKFIWKFEEEIAREKREERGEDIIKEEKRKKKEEPYDIDEAYRKLDDMFCEENACVAPDPVTGDKATVTGAKAAEDAAASVLYSRETKPEPVVDSDPCIAEDDPEEANDLTEEDFSGTNEDDPVSANENPIKPEKDPSCIVDRIKEADDGDMISG